MIEQQKHLTHEEIATCAEFINYDKYADLADYMKLHLKNCDQCAIEVDTVAQFDHEIASKKTKSPKLKLISYTSIAAAIVLAVALGNFIWNIQKPIKNTKNLQFTLEDQAPQDPDQDTKKIGTEKTSSQQANPQHIKLNQKKPIKEKGKQKQTRKAENKKEQLHYAQYKPNRQLEKLATRSQDGFYRGSNAKKTTTVINYPATNIVQWPNTDNEDLILEIHDNNAQLTHEVKTTDSVFQLPKLSPGLFYYKIINEDFDLLYVGKIQSGKPAKTQK